jgi:hypothetical protein
MYNNIYEKEDYDECNEKKYCDLWFRFSHFHITGNDKNKIQYLSYEILL